MKNHVKSDDISGGVDQQNFNDQGFNQGQLMMSSITTNVARLPDEYITSMPMNQTLVPLYHDTNNTTTFVNSKQYQPILRLRCKKIKRMKKAEQMKNSLTKQLPIRKNKKSKVKYESRSKHAKKRTRAKNGKFLSKAEMERLEAEEGTEGQ